MTVLNAHTQIMDAIKKYDDGQLTLASVDTIIEETLGQVQSTGFEAGQAFNEDEYDDVDYEEEEYDEDDEDDFGIELDDDE